MSIETKNLTYIYGEGTPFKRMALDNINIKIEKGEFIGLIGHTGSGKSTLIQHLNGLLKPTKGYVYYNGSDININKENIKNIRQKVGLVFQYPEHQLFEMSIYKDVSFGPKNMGLSEEEINKRVINSLQSVGISKNIYDKSPFELSGGQKRRVAIAGVLAMEPDVLILDEPTAGLDPKGRDEILEQVKQLHETKNITVILVSHSMEDIAKYVKRIIVMDQGKVKIDDIPKKVFGRVKELENMGLAVPQVTYLAARLKEKGFHINENVINIDEMFEIVKNELNIKK